MLKTQKKKKVFTLFSAAGERIVEAIAAETMGQLWCEHGVSRDPKDWVKLSLNFGSAPRTHTDLAQQIQSVSKSSVHVSLGSVFAHCPNDSVRSLVVALSRGVARPLTAVAAAKPAETSMIKLPCVASVHSGALLLSVALLEKIVKALKLTAYKTIATGPNSVTIGMGTEDAKRIDGAAIGGAIEVVVTTWGEQHQQPH